MGSKIFKIEISFPVEMDIDRTHFIELDKLLTKICEDWEKNNPGQVMWPFGHGAKMLCHPMMCSDDEPIPFDDSIYHIEIATREAYPSERNYNGG